MRLKYGEKWLPFELGDNSDVYLTREPVKGIDQSSFRQRFTKELRRLAPDLRRTAVVVGDKTRLCGYPEYLPIVLDSLVQSGASKESLKIYIAYGTHSPQRDEESLKSYGSAYREYEFIHHDCADESCFQQLGDTGRGTAVYVRQDIRDATFLLTFGAISHHYFAGYGGGRKLIFPGLGYKPAIYQNHRLFLNRETGELEEMCRAGCLDGNPLAEDLAEVESFCPADLSIHGILNSQGEVCDLLIGDGTDFFRHACAVHGELYGIKTEKRYDLVIASCGGHPKDINLIQSHKAIHNSAAFTRDGGHLIVLAKCGDGIGSTTLLPWLKMGSYPSAFKKLSTNYEGNGGTALSLMEKLKRIRISLVTELDEEVSTTIGIEKLTHTQAQEYVTRASTSVAALPNASLLVNTN